MKNKLVLVGWILKVFIFLFMVLASARGKFFDWDGKEEMFNQMGFTLDSMFAIGIVEVLVAALFLLPARLGFLGALLMTAYLGGAVVVHVRVGDVFYFPIVIGLLVWVSVFLSNLEFRKFILKKN